MTADRIYLLNAALVAALIAASGAVFRRLPPTIPAHFAWAGDADAWSSTSRATWFVVPFIAAACGVGIYLLSLIGRRKPSMYNLPRKAEFLALSAERREQVLGMLEMFGAWLSVAVTIEAAAVQFSVFSTATGRTEGLSLTTVMALIAGTASLSIGGALFFQRLDERIAVLWKEEHAAQV